MQQASPPPPILLGGCALLVKPEVVLGLYGGAVECDGLSRRNNVGWLTVSDFFRSMLQDVKRIA